MFFVLWSSTYLWRFEYPMHHVMEILYMQRFRENVELVTDQIRKYYQK